MPPSPTSYYTTTQTDSNNVLSLISLTKTYSKKTVLEDVTFRIVRDDKIVVVGENGVGEWAAITCVHRVQVLSRR